jgi:DNA repair exonuclease SbcCD ATPase subunit
LQRTRNLEPSCSEVYVDMSLATQLALGILALDVVLELEVMLEELEAVLEVLEATLEELVVTVDELEATLDELEALEELDVTLEELEATLDELEATLDELEALEELDATGVGSEEELPEEELLLRVVEPVDDLRRLIVSIDYLHRKSVTLTRLGLANWCSRHRSLQSIYRPLNLRYHQQQVLACRV